MPGISLRPWQPKDAPRLAELLGNPRVNRFLSDLLPRPYSLDHAQGFIRECLQTQPPERAILADGLLAGGIGARIEGSEADIGYWLGEAYWRQGIMKQAIPLFLHELQQLAPQTERIIARAFDFNAASQALLQACGFRKLDTFSLLRAPDGLEHPVVHFAYPAKDWPPPGRNDTNSWAATS